MKLKLVKKIIEAKNTYSFFFEPDTTFDWQAGQYLVLKINGQERQLTIASSPTEKIIQITVRIRKESEFKQSLNNLKIGDAAEANGPFGTFTFLNHKHSLQDRKSKILNHVFLAGGIGITPFRSFIKYNLDNNLRLPMFLIYSNSNPDFIFKKELDIWQKENDFLKFEYVDTSVVSRIDKLKISKFIGNWKLEIGNYAFSAIGPKNFVNSMEDILEELKVPQNNVKTEKFIGY